MMTHHQKIQFIATAWVVTSLVASVAIVLFPSIAVACHISGAAAGAVANLVCLWGDM